MKLTLSTLLVVGLLSCAENPKNGPQSYDPFKIDSSTYFPSVADKNCKSDFVDILILQQPEKQVEFFRLMDSTIRVQYQNNEYHPGLNHDISKRLMRKFLMDLEHGACLGDNHYEADYDVVLQSKIFSEQASSSENLIARFYPENCNFRLILNYSFWSKDFGASVSQVVYEFSIEKGEIKEFTRFIPW